MSEEFIFKEDVRIYDTDAQGVVHYAGYYRFFTDAIEQFAKERIGTMFPLVDENTWFVVVESNARYYKSAHSGERLSVMLSPKLVSDKAIRFDFKIYRDGDLICDGYIVQVAIDKNKWKAVPIPKKFVEKLAS
ncbi:acyl-CoA thioesterase [Candidatus Parvarchaeota archaeon]|nr:acyl-CoA thioesterase [Candidatus Parvarchaeota archaeon]